MYPQLMLSLAEERRRDMTADLNAHRPVRQRAVRRAPHLNVPRLRVNWSRTTLAATAGRRRGRSYVIVISATRML
jgi:hypothetical protein